MRLLHIANTNLELELEKCDSMDLECALKQNPIIHQLQFLPLLYREEDDGVGVTDAPYQGPFYQLLSTPSLPFDAVESWGPSKEVARWAQEKGLLYDIPSWDVVREVNSKAFSFQQSKPLPQAELIDSWSDLMQWIQTVEGPKVLKSCFGVSGRGHLLLPTHLDKIKSFAEREFNANRPLIAEPWVERKLDFSTQWLIEKDASITYMGSTVLQSDKYGRYAGNIVGEESTIFGEYFSQLLNHKEYVFDVLKKMRALGFVGNVGIDSMIWGDGTLHPIVEINARKTMGWISLQIRKRLFPNQSIQVSYGAANRSTPLLPQGIIKPSGEVMSFERNLYVDVLA